MPSFNSGVTASSYVFPTVTGGTLTSDSTYYYRTFTGSDNLVISDNSLEVEVLIIAGGGPGGG